MKKIFFSILAFATLAFLLNIARASGLSSSLRGMILLQVEENGEAWYIYPKNEKRYYLGRPDDAFDIMRELGLGIKHDELTKYQNSSFPSRLSGYILLDVEKNGEAYYIYPKDMQDYYLGRPQDAFDIMRNLGLGITNSNLSKIFDADTASVIVDTNQKKCYDNSSQINCPDTEGENFYGQDAQYAGTQPSYIDNGDGTVTDNNTGLMWLQDAGDKVDYYDAISAADSYEFAGYSDWRVPTIKELYSLMDFSGEDIDPQADVTPGLKPFINDDVFVFKYGDKNDGDRTIDSQWVTSNIYVADVMNNQECFFGVNFADGRIKCYPTRKGKGYFMRYVRGNTGYGENNFQNNGDGTITDSSSGLMWQKETSKEGMKWADALKYCESLNLAGKTDWRLPNAKELEYLVDYTKSPDTTGTPAIDSVFETPSITNEAGQKDYPYFWTSTTHVSQEGGDTAVYISFGRAMGYMQEFRSWVDVHGAGAQRSDPKIGDPSDYPNGFGPQGDARRIYNYARCVRGGAEFTTDADKTSSSTSSSTTGGTALPNAPAEAISACSGKGENDSCTFQSLQGSISGTCRYVSNGLACIP